jgi:hypothetical protein
MEYPSPDPPPMEVPVQFAGAVTERGFVASKSWFVPAQAYKKTPIPSVLALEFVSWIV